MTSRVEVTAGVIVERQRVLVCQRVAGSRHGLKWEFPGGKREAGETLAECLRRELEEELGIVAAIGAVLATTRHNYEGGELEITFFEVDHFEGVPTNRIFADMRWVKITELEGVDFLEADLAFVRRLAKGRVTLSR